MTFRQIVFIALASLPLMACGHLTLPSLRVSPPPNALSKCPSLDPIAETSDMGGLLLYCQYVITEYNDCASRHDVLVDFNSK